MLSFVPSQLTKQFMDSLENNGRVRTLAAIVTAIRLLVDSRGSQPISFPVPLLSDWSIVKVKTSTGEYQIIFKADLQRKELRVNRILGSLS